MTDEEVAAKIAEAVKAAEEAQSERIIALLKRNGVVEGARGFIAEIRRLDQPGALDRYVASKVREAKIAAYERCERASYGSKIIALLFNEWAAAERKKKGSQNVNP